MPTQDEIYRAIQLYPTAVQLAGTFAREVVTLATGVGLDDVINEAAMLYADKRPRAKLPVTD